MTDVNFVKVSKAGRVLVVHPASLQQHLALGWVQVPNERFEPQYSQQELEKLVKEAVEKALAEQKEPEQKEPEQGQAETPEPAKEKKK